MDTHAQLNRTEGGHGYRPEALHCRLYALTTDGADFDELLQASCRHLAGALGARLVVIGQRHDNGSVIIRAASSENGLWADLMRLPERWDGTVAGQGAGAVALRTGQPARIGVADEGFLPWRAAAEREHVRIAAAWPVRLPGGDFVVEVFSETADFAADAPARSHVAAAVRDLGDVLCRVAKLREDRLLARALDSAGSAAFIADLHGTIIWCNDAFCRLYGYAREEVLGRNPRFLQSGQQGMRYYRNLWSTIRAGKVWSGETVDRDRHGNAYTVRQTISPVEVDGRITHYLSVQDNITRDHEMLDRHELRLETDELSGLQTRAAFTHHVDSTLRDGTTPATYLLITMRTFHGAIAARGMEMEERLVSEVGRRIRDIVPHDAMSGNLGAGEYGLFIEGDAGQAHVDALAGRLREALRDGYAIARDTAPGVRIATARAPEDGTAFAALHRHADRKFADEPLRPARRRVRP